MTDLELSRRGLIAVSGAGLAAAALSACTKPGNPSEGAAATESGLETHGADPNGSAPAAKVPFNPKFMSLVHITSAGAWAINSNDAHFAFAQENYDKAARTSWACEIFNNKIKQGWRRFSEAPRGSRFQVYDRTPDAPKPDYADELEFVRFGFGQQHDIYVFFEHAVDAISFDSVGKKHFSFGERLQDGKKADPNEAFFDGDVVTDSSLLGDLAKLGTLLRLNNYYTVKDSSGYHLLPHGEIKQQTYELNIIYKTRSGITMLIDPQTGNGPGNEP